MQIMHHSPLSRIDHEIQAESRHNPTKARSAQAVGGTVRERRSSPDYNQVALPFDVDQRALVIRRFPRVPPIACAIGLFIDIKPTHR
jgi:hypothetical protein